MIHFYKLLFNFRFSLRVKYLKSILKQFPLYQALLHFAGTYIFSDNAIIS